MTPKSLTPSEEVQRSLRMRDGIRRLGQMEAINSIGDGLEWESEAVKFQTAIDQAAVVNGEFPSPKLETEDGMQKKTLIAGDVHNYYREIEQPQPPTVVTQPAPAPAPAAKPSGIGQVMGPALLGAAMLGTGAGGVMLYDYLTAMPDGTTIQQPVDPGEYVLGVEVKPHE